MHHFNKLFRRAEMVYPLNMRNASAGGFALASDEAEHKALSDAGYEPKWTPAEDVVPVREHPLPKAEEQVVQTVESLRAKLDAAGIAYDKRWGIDKLKAALPK